MGLRRTGSKVWKDIRGVIRAIGRSSRSGKETQHLLLCDVILICPTQALKLLQIRI